MRNKRNLLIEFKKVFFILLISAIFFSCFEELIDNPSGNTAPETFTFLYPDSTISQQPSRLRVSWWGDDPDGTIIGFYFKWEGIDSSWTFTTSNDSLFSLPIGSADTSYSFIVSSVDNEGNGVYDSNIFQNGINFGPEPFIDANNNGFYNPGESFFDIGLIDPTPATSDFPIINSTPVVAFNELSVLPDTSFPVMTFAWNAADLDGVESITKINIALNDTTEFISLPGGIRAITIRTRDFPNPVAEMEILINGSDQNIFPQKLPGLKLNDSNKFYIQAEDISGAKSAFISLPDTGGNSWYVKQPRGNLLIVDDFIGSATSDNETKMFYDNVFSSIAGGALINKFETIDIFNSALPFENVTFTETIKLFDFIFWYSASNPRLDLLNLITSKFRDSGGKIAFSIVLQDSTANFPYDIGSLQGFLPIDSLGAKVDRGLLPGAEILPVNDNSGYPILKTTANFTFARVFHPNTFIAEAVYKVENPSLTGTIGFKSANNSLFFTGLSLHQSNGNQNVSELLEKVFIIDFGLVP